MDWMLLRLCWDGVAGFELKEAQTSSLSNPPNRLTAYGPSKFLLLATTIVLSLISSFSRGCPQIVPSNAHGQPLVTP